MKAAIRKIKYHNLTKTFDFLYQTTRYEKVVALYSIRCIIFLNILLLKKSKNDQLLQYPQEGDVHLFCRELIDYFVSISDNFGNLL